MKKNKLRLIFIVLIVVVTSVFSGCQALSGLTNKVPEKYTDGIKYDRDFPDDIFEIYDDAIVFESKELFGAIVLAYGTEDDVDDVVDFFMDFFEDNDITLVYEDEGRDTYYAKGYFEGYEFKVQVEEPDGEYVEDLFSCIVYISTEEKEETAISVKADPTATPQPENTQAPTAQPTPVKSEVTATPKPEQTSASNGETPLYNLYEGSWELRWSGSGNTVYNMDATLHINGDGTGTYYYYDYDSDDRNFMQFNYEVENGQLLLETGSGIITYDAYYDDGILHLIHAENGVEMYFANWNEVYSIYPSDSEFTAYGDWMYYEPETGYTETISFWPNGSGYIYNWGGGYENLLMFWEFEDGIFTIYDELGNEYTYGIVHRGEVFELHQLNGSVFFYHRVSHLNWFAASYYMTETNEDDLSDWAISFNYDGTYDGTLEGSAISGSWYIEKSSGQLALEIYDEYYYFNYHYDIGGLHLWDETDTYYYYFMTVG